MLNYRGYEAWITSDGQKLPEYEISIDTEKHRATCWIAGQEGKEFIVNWRDLGGQVDTMSYITLDGFTVPGRFLYGDGIGNRAGVRTSPSKERPFVFAKVDEEADTIETDADPKQLGMIILRIRRIRRIGGHMPNTPRPIPNLMRGRENYYEMRAGFGKETTTHPQIPVTFSIEPFDKANPGSYVTFIFRYRTKEFLEAQGIKPSDSGWKPRKKTVSVQALKTAQPSQIPTKTQLSNLPFLETMVAEPALKSEPHQTPYASLTWLPGETGEMPEHPRAVSVPLTPDPSPKISGTKRLRQVVSTFTPQKARRTNSQSTASSQRSHDEADDDFPSKKEKSLDLTSNDNKSPSDKVDDNPPQRE